MQNRINSRKALEKELADGLVIDFSDFASIVAINYSFKNKNVFVRVHVNIMSCTPIQHLVVISIKNINHI